MNTDKTVKTGKYWTNIFLSWVCFFVAGGIFFQWANVLSKTGRNDIFVLFIIMTALFLALGAFLNFRAIRALSIKERDSDSSEIPEIV